MSLAATALAVLIGVGRGPEPEPSPPPPALEAAHDAVVLSPIALQGALPPHWQSALQDALVQGLGRGRLDVVDAPPADYRIDTQLRADDRSYAIEIVVVDTRTDATLVQAQSVCDVCGLSEVQETLVTLAAGLRDRIDRLSLAAPRLRITSRPAGAVVFLDGERVGITPLEHSASPGPHRIGLSLDGHRSVSREVDLVSGLQEAIDVALLAVAPPVHPKPTPVPDESSARRPMTAAGWVLFGAGLAGAGAGGALLGLHGRSAQSRCSGTDLDAAGNCRYLYSTQAAGAAALSSGIVAVAVGVALLVVDRRRGRGRTPRRRAQ